MISLEESLISKMKDSLEGIGLPEGIVEDFEKYLKDDSFENSFLKSVPQINFKTLSDDAIKKAADVYSLLERHESTGFFTKYINTLFYVGRGSLSLIVKRAVYNFDSRRMDQQIKLGIDPLIPVLIYAESCVYYEYMINTKFIKDFYEIYDTDPRIIFSAYDNASVNAKLVFAMVIVEKRSDGYGEYKKWIEDTVKDSIKILFNGAISEKEIEECKKYIDGGIFISENVPHNLINSLQSLAVNSYVMKLITGACISMAEVSKPALRMVRLLLMSTRKEAFSALYSFEMLGYGAGYSKIDKLNEIIGIQPECSIAFMAENYADSENRYRIGLKEAFENNRGAFDKAMELCSEQAKLYMCRFLWEKNKENGILHLYEKQFIKEFTNFADNNNMDPVYKADFIAYVAGEKSLEEVRNKLKAAVKSRNMQSAYYYNQPIIRMLSLYKDVSPVFGRSLVVLLYLEYYEFMVSIAYEFNEKGMKDPYSYIASALQISGAEPENIVQFLAESKTYYSYSFKPDESLTSAFNLIMRSSHEAVLNSIKNCSADGRAFLIEKLFNYNKSLYTPFIIENMDDNSKEVKDTIVKYLTTYPKAYDQIVPLLKSKKSNIRECAVRIISGWDGINTEKILTEALQNEKSSKIRNLLMGILNLEAAEDKSENGCKASGAISCAELVKNILKGNRKNSLGWLDFETLPKVKLKNSDNYAEDEMIKAVMISYASAALIRINSDAEKIAELLDKSSLSVLSSEVFDRWLEKGAESKKKWVLAFCAINGGHEIINKFRKQITEWPEHARGAIACEAVSALALNEEEEALLIVDGISRKFKFRQVKEAAGRTLDFAAEERGLDRETLSDMIMPDLGFDARGERVFDYGERKFTARLTAELSVETYDDNEKKIKNLPAPGKKDDAEKAELASSEFKALKKLLKNTASIQQIRLEMALSMDRKWDKTSWIKLFVNNPIMHQFAIGLIWGTYEHGRLVDTFRYMEDGTFNTKDEEEYELMENPVIGLVHPIELSAEDMALWKEQLENYEIRQPFEQLNRKVYTINEEEKKMKWVERFGGIMLNGRSLSGKIMSSGWYRGSVQDGGCYHTFYKEDSRLGIGTELEFSGSGIGYEDEDVTVYTLTFYKAGTVERGSYVYDTIKEQHLLRPAEVPERFFSEILYQVDKALISKTGFNDLWKKDANI